MLYHLRLEASGELTWVGTRHRLPEVSEEVMLEEMRHCHLEASEEVTEEGMCHRRLEATGEAMVEGIRPRRREAPGELERMRHRHLEASAELTELLAIQIAWQHRQKVEAATLVPAKGIRNVDFPVNPLQEEASGPENVDHLDEQKVPMEIRW
jgi:hypothetical protein